MVFASVIHERMSAAWSFVPTSSRGPLTLPFPATEWHREHFWSVKSFSPFALRS